MGRKRKVKEFICQRCLQPFTATVCVSGMCQSCRKKPPGEAPLCACGCGEHTRWKGTIKGGHWNKYIHGHHINDPEIGNPRHKSDCDPWNKGNRAYTINCANPDCGKEVKTSHKEQLYCSHECYVTSAVVGREPWHKGLKKGDHPGLDKLGDAVSASRLINPVHNKDKTKENYEPLKRAGEKISPVLKEMYASGDLENWNKGLSRKDPRWDAACNRISATKAHQIVSGVNSQQPCIEKDLVVENSELSEKETANISNSNSQLSNSYTDGRWYKFARVGWMTNNSTRKKELFRSSYEAAYMNALNNSGVVWTTQHGITVRWRDGDGFEHRYVPDFQVWISEDVFEIHEIKSAYINSLEKDDGEGNGLVKEKNSQQQFPRSIKIGGAFVKRFYAYVNRMEKDEDNQRKFQAAIRKGWREGWEFRVLTEDTNPEFDDFDPATSEWFIEYDKKTLKLLAEQAGA